MKHMNDQPTNPKLRRRLSIEGDTGNLVSRTAIKYPARATIALEPVSWGGNSITVSVAPNGAYEVIVTRYDDHGHPSVEAVAEGTLS